MNDACAVWHVQYRGSQQVEVAASRTLHGVREFFRVRVAVVVEVLSLRAACRMFRGQCAESTG